MLNIAPSMLSLSSLNYRRLVSNCRAVFARCGVVVLSIILALPGVVSAAGPRVLPEGKQPNDARLQPPKDLNGYFPLVGAEVEGSSGPSGRRKCGGRLQWREGIWPLPEKTPLNAVIHGQIDKGDYTVEKVYFESVPGFFVTGNLYRPKTTTGKVAGRALSAWPLERRAVHRYRPAGGAEGDRHWLGAVRERRPQPACRRCRCNARAWAASVFTTT